MDFIIVAIIVALAAYVTLKRFLNKFKPTASPCGNGCSCGTQAQCCSPGIRDRMQNRSN